MATQQSISISEDLKKLNELRLVSKLTTKRRPEIVNRVKYFEKETVTSSSAQKRGTKCVICELKVTIQLNKNVEDKSIRQEMMEDLQESIDTKDSSDSNKPFSFLETMAVFNDSEYDNETKEEEKEARPETSKFMVTFNTDLTFH